MRENGKRQPFAKKSFGQNFLTDENYISKIISAVDPQDNETIIEIGAGRGALTAKLLDSGANVIAIELERAMIGVLKSEFADFPRFQLVEADALRVDFEKLTESLNKNLSGQSVKLVANLPYNISTAILQKLIEQRRTFSEMILMFQREVVNRIIAPPGSSERGFLSVMTEAFLDAEKLFDVPPNAFRPAPKVWSAIVRLIPKQTNLTANPPLFREIVSQGFSQKRKTIYNNLKKLPASVTTDAESLLKNSQIDAHRRAETLSLDEWLKLAASAS